MIDGLCFKSCKSCCANWRTIDPFTNNLRRAYRIPPSKAETSGVVTFNSMGPSFGPQLEFVNESILLMNTHSARDARNASHFRRFQPLFQERLFRLNACVYSWPVGLILLALPVFPIILLSPAIGLILL